MSREVRKHHEARLKKKRAKYFMAKTAGQRLKGKAYHSPAMCSCSMCGNPRKHLRGKGGLTLQERAQVEIDKGEKA